MGINFRSKREEELTQENQKLTKTVKRLEAEIEELQHQLSIHNSLTETPADIVLQLKIAEGKLDDAEQKYEKLKKSYYFVQEELKKYQGSSDQKPAPNPDLNSTAGSDSLSGIDRKLDKLQEALADTTHKDTIIRELHGELQKLNRDIFSQIAKPYLNTIIRIHTNFASMVAKAKEEYMQTQSPVAENIYKRMMPTLLMIQDCLEDEFDVRAFSPEVGDRYDPKMHQGIQSLLTHDPELAGTVVACKECGFMRADNGKVVKQALVVVYRLDK